MTCCSETHSCRLWGKIMYLIMCVCVCVCMHVCVRHMIPSLPGDIKANQSDKVAACEAPPASAVSHSFLLLLTF